MIPRSLSTWLATTATVFTFAACVDADTEIADTAAALEQDNGGLTMDDEQPLFADDDAFTTADIEAGDGFTDPLAEDPDFQAMDALDGALHARLTMLWGQLPPDLAPEAYARDWSGRLSLNRGAIVVRRTIGFEEATDRVLPRTDRMAVEFRSITRPFADGLVLELVDPDPASADPLTLTYDLLDGSSHSIEVRTLLDGPVVREVDDQGDRIAASLVRDDDPCNHGFGRGRWRALREGLGRMIGVISNADGEPIGHIRGIWGERRNDEQVFFGKYIAVGGEFRGIFAGHYRAGEMHGRWFDRNGETGRLDGAYRESLPGAATGGHFLLRWAETSCAQDIPTDSL